MDIKDIFKKLKPPEPEGYMELESQKEEPNKGKVLIQIENLSYASDVERIQEKLRKGMVLIINMKELKSKDINELKHVVAKIKKTCFALDGDIVGVSDDWLLVTSKVAKIHREDAE